MPPDPEVPVAFDVVTVVVLPSRLVLAQGANVDRDSALKLLGYVDFDAVAAAK